MVELIDRAFVPVWVNVRSSPYPDLPGLAPIRADLRIDASGYLRGLPWWFHSRAFLLSPDGATLLNPTESHDAFPSTDPKRFRAMLKRAAARCGAL